MSEPLPAIDPFYAELIGRAALELFKPRPALSLIDGRKRRWAERIPGQRPELKLIGKEASQ